MKSTDYNRRDFIRQMSAALLGSSLISGTKTGCRQSTGKPNIIIIMADDLGYNDLGCYGNKDIKTPNLDKMAENGIRFTDFHANAPVCSPTRAALVTGRYQQRSGINGVVTVKKYRDTGLAPEELTFAEYFIKANYKTALYGKWHLGYKTEFNPYHQGFDEFIGFVSGNVDYFSHIDGAGKADWWHNDRLSDEPGYATKLITEHGLRFIEKNRHTPFCLYLAHAAPHFPFQGPKNDAFRKTDDPEPMRGVRDDKMNAYREMIESMDNGIGKIMDKLDELEIAENTLIFFCSDNGPDVGSASPFRGKKSELYEGGHRVPAIALWPGKIPKGRISDQTIMTMDLFPTILSIVGINPEDNHHLDGIDISVVLFDGGRLPERTLFWYFKEQRAMRKGDWKMINNELYNLKTDIKEENDLAKTQPQKLLTMQKEYEQWFKDVNHNVVQRT